MEKLKQKVLLGLCILLFLTPSFLFLEVHMKSSSHYSPIPLNNHIMTDESIFIPDSTPTLNLIQEKVSLKFQNLLKTQDLAESITCFIVLRDQPTKTIAEQTRVGLITDDKVELRRTIYAETQKRILPTQDSIGALIESVDGKILQNFVVLNAILAEIPLRALDTLVQSPQIARIEPNYQLTLTLSYGQPIVTNTTSPGWDYTYNGSGVVVAVCDTGIDKMHPNLLGKVISEKSFVTGEPADDLDGHGTHVAGIIASDDSTYHGIATNVSLVNVKIMDTGGSGDTTQLINGIEWALTNASIDVINLSAGTSSIPDDGDSSISKFVDAVVSAYNVVWVNAAGNIGASGIEVPGDALNCISVGNLDDNSNLNPSGWTLTPSSSRGPTDDGRIKPDITAPGETIMSCNDIWEGANPDFVSKTGTSMAAPHVAGAAALLLQYLKLHYSSLSSNHALITKGMLLHTAYDKGTVGPDPLWGYGAVDMGAVWNFLQTGNFSVQTLTPSHSIAEYRLTLNTSQIINTTLVWNREASTDFTYIYYSDLANLDIRLENATGSPIDYANSTVNNVEHLTYDLSAGNYSLYVEADGLQDIGDVPYILLSDSPLTFIGFIHTWTLYEIIIIISVLSIVGICLVYIFLWLKDSKKPKEAPRSEEPTYEDTSSGDPSWPEWS